MGSNREDVKRLHTRDGVRKTLTSSAEGDAAPVFPEMTASSRRAASSKPSSSNPVVNKLAVLHYSDCSSR